MDEGQEVGAYKIHGIPSLFGLRGPHQLSTIFISWTREQPWLT